MFWYHFHAIIMVQCFEAECNHCSDRETCTFYRFPKDWKNSHDGWQIVLNRYIFVPLTYACIGSIGIKLLLEILCNDNFVDNVTHHLSVSLDNKDCFFIIKGYSLIIY